MTVVCLPDEQAYQLVGDVPGVRTLIWDGSVAPPPGIASTEFLVGSYTRGPLAVDQFSLMPRLRVVQVLSAGVDAWLDVVPPGVALCNGRGVHGLSTAELAVALVLAQLRDIPRYARQQAGEVWLSGERESLCDKRVLIVGAGDIGGHVKEVLNALGATVTLVGRSARAGIAGFAQLPALLPDQDVVVLAVPLTEQTRGLVDERFLARMKDQAILVNVGRGPTVVTEALLAALESGRLRAGLDVTDPEPLPRGHPLWHAPNLLLTPHVGGGSSGWDRRGYRLVRAQLERFMSGQQLANMVDVRRS
jgi:phosphoglycerate dehydrogenase-like enzyme